MKFMMKPYEQKFPWNLDWNLLRTFMVVVDQRGPTRAAEYLGVTQPTISSALKRLEETVGKRLAVRRPGYFKVTEAGHILYQESAAMFGAVSQIPDLVIKAEGQVNGHISIVMASHVVSPHFDALLQKFNVDHPDVTYSMSVADSREVLNFVRQKQATFGLCLVREHDPHLVTTPLFREFFGLYCGPGHKLFGNKRVKLSQLRGESSVSFQTDSESGPLSSVTHLRERALLKSELKGISSNLPEVRRMIVAGLGIGALPVHVAKRDVEKGLLWQLPPYSGLPVVEVCIAINPKRSQNPAEAAFIKALEELTDSVPLSERTYE